MKEREDGKGQHVSSTGESHRKGAGGKGGMVLPNPRILGRVELTTIRPGKVVPREECRISDIINRINVLFELKGTLGERPWWRRPRKPLKVVVDVYDDSIHELVGDLMDAIDKYIEKFGGDSREEVIERLHVKWQS